ncbi:hypothetical protein BGZ58_000051 [Dissophora ornata]|nr:hypothetical protein BGZ58_000051 [Dissophora ornata]
MKRRYTAGGIARNRYPTNDEYSHANPVNHLTLHTSQQREQQQHLSQTHYVQPEERSSEESSELGLDPIDGRVLKKMRRIKLNSDSPPLDSPDSTRNDFDTGVAPKLQGSQDGITQQSHDVQNQLHRFEPSRAFGRIKISTRSNLPEPAGPTGPAAKGNSDQLAGALQNETSAADSPDVAFYFGMNNILHQMHAMRFGIPEEISSGTDASLAHEESRQLLQQRYQQQQQQQQQQQEQHLQQQQRYYHPPSQGTMFTANTAWHQAQRVLQVERQAMDVDDEMADVGVSAGINSSFAGFGMGGIQGLQQAPYATEGQQQLQYQPEPLSQRHSQEQQQQQQQQTAHNEYQDINAQLRAAFLARPEMDKRYR